MKSLVEKIKEILGENVQDVKVSTKLVDSACCLVAPDTGMDVQMERIMKIQNKDKPHRAKLPPNGPPLAGFGRYSSVRTLLSWATG